MACLSSASLPPPHTSHPTSRRWTTQSPMTTSPHDYADEEQTRSPRINAVAHADLRARPESHRYPLDRRQTCLTFRPLWGGFRPVWGAGPNLSAVENVAISPLL